MNQQFLSHHQRQLNHFKLRHGCRGQSAVEMVGGIIVFAIMMSGLISFSLYLYMNHAFLTAVREGARYASTDSRLAVAGTNATAVAAVRTEVISMIQAGTGITVPGNSITVTGPTGATVGRRNVRVSIVFDYPAPIQVGTLINFFTGGGSDLDNFPIQAQAVMRYEE